MHNTAKLEDVSIREFEVIYIGKAFGDGSRSAFDRLKSHWTLQRILAEAATSRPDDEMSMFLFKYEPYRLLLSFDGITGAEIDDERDDQHLSRIIEAQIPARQQISLAEAGLIRYFRPEYNIIYKESFPNEDQLILRECYHLDFSGLVVEINTEVLHSYLWSTLVPKGVHHFAKFDLHDAQVRRSFFSIVDQDGRYALLNDSGPIY